MRHRASQEISIWSWVFLIATALPYLYVLAFGRNMPWWVYIVLALILVHGFYTLYQRRKKKSRRAS